MPKILKGLEKTLISAREVAGLFEQRSRGGGEQYLRYKSQNITRDTQN